MIENITTCLALNLIALDTWDWHPVWETVFAAEASIMMHDYILHDQSR